MATMFIVLTAIFLAATLITLGVGVFGMGKGGDFNRRNSNKLMQLRVLFQGLAIGAFVLYLLAR